LPRAELQNLHDSPLAPPAFQVSGQSNVKMRVVLP
jgi:hypothetical protein